MTDMVRWEPGRSRLVNGKRVRQLVPVPADTRTETWTGRSKEDVMRELRRASLAGRVVRAWPVDPPGGGCYAVGVAVREVPSRRFSSKVKLAASIVTVALVFLGSLGWIVGRYVTHTFGQGSAIGIPLGLFLGGLVCLYLGKRAGQRQSVTVTTTVRVK